MTDMKFEAEKQTVLNLVATNEIYNDLTVTVERGKRDMLDADGKVTKSQNGFMVSTDKHRGFGAKIETAVGVFLKNMKYGTKDDFAFDTDNEFFAAAPKDNVDKSDPWAGKDAEELAEMRVAAENAAIAARDDEQNAQLHWLDHSRVIDGAYDRLKTKSKVEKWAAGTEANSDAAPMLAKLGKATNALNEARLMARLSDEQFAHLHANINRGKMIDWEIRKGAETYMQGAAAGAMAADLDTEEVDEKERYTFDVIDAAMKGAIDAFGISEDYADINTGIALAKAALEVKVKSAAENGIDKHTADDDERAVLRDILASYAVIDWLDQCDNAIGDVEKALDLEDGDKTKVKAVRGARSALYQGGFYKRLETAVTKEANHRAANAKADGAKKAMHDGQAFQGAKKACDELNARDMAARIFASFKDHSAYVEVFDELALMVRAQKAADAKAKADAEKAKDEAA